MDGKQKWALEQYMAELSETMDIENVSLQLLISAAITSDCRKKFLRILDEKERRIELLTFMQEKSPKNGTAWEHLINALVAVQQSHLAEKLNALLESAPESVEHHQTEPNRKIPKLWEVPLRNTQFTGRDQLLADLITCFSSNKLSTSKQNASSKSEQTQSQSHVTVISACHGMGGVGKTQLAIELIYRNIEMYPHIFWIRANESSEIEIAYQKLAQDLHMDTQKSIDDTVREIKAWFQSHPGCLLVYDNALNPTLIKKYIPQKGTNVLITSRYTNWQSLGTSFTVDVFTIEEAREYVQKILVDPVIMDDVDTLAKLLGCLPLALAQACAYIENNVTISDYLALYKARKENMLADDSLPEDDHEPVYVTFDITIKAIEKESKLAPQLLNLCAYFHSDDIPKSLLQAFAENAENNPQSEIFDTALKKLASYSMLKIHSDKKTVSIHQILQEVIQLELKKCNKNTFLDQAYHQLIKMFPNGEQIQDYKDKITFIPHMETVLCHLDSKLSNKILIEQLTITSLLENLFIASNALGDYTKQRDYLERVLRIKELHYGSDHPDVARTLANLGSAYGSLGDYIKQRDYLERALKIQEFHYGPDHPENARTLANLGNAYGNLGDYAKQRDYLERALKIQELHYGPDHSEVGKTITNLGVAYGSLRDYTKQRDYLERALKIQEFHYGLDHPEVAKTITNLGVAYGSLGDYPKKRDYLERALQIFERHYGINHSAVAITLTNLGNAFGSLEDYTKQRDYLERALKIFERHYGLSHPEVAKTLTNLGVAYGNLKEYTQKRDYLERALKIFEVHYDPYHLHIAKTLVNLGKAYESLKDYSKQRDCLERALKIQEFHYEPEHPELGTTLADLYFACLKLGDKTKIHDYLERALKIEQLNYARDHPEDTINHYFVAYGLRD